jgi:hypothetical protein
MIAGSLLLSKGKTDSNAIQEAIRTKPFFMRLWTMLAMLRF